MAGVAFTWQCCGELLSFRGNLWDDNALVFRICRNSKEAPSLAGGGAGGGSRYSDIRVHVLLVCYSHPGGIPVSCLAENETPVGPREGGLMPVLAANGAAARPRAKSLPD